jgi:RecB family endonuclease NucS
VEAQRDVAKAKLKEIRAITRKRIRQDTTVKHTESSLEAEIDTDPQVIEAQMKFIRAEHDAATWYGAVDSMKAKKDVLIQLGSDRRKEIG